MIPYFYYLLLGLPSQRLELVQSFDPSRFLNRTHLSIHSGDLWFRACVAALSCLSPCYPLGCSLPGSCVHWILQARPLEWAAISLSREPFPPRESNLHLLHLQVDSLLLKVWLTSPPRDGVMVFFKVARGRPACAEHQGTFGESRAGAVARLQVPGSRISRDLARYRRPAMDSQDGKQVGTLVRRPPSPRILLRGFTCTACPAVPRRRNQSPQGSCR